MPLANADAKRYRYGLVGLKGFLFKRFAEAVCKDAELLKAVYEEPIVFQEVINQQETQLELSLGLSIPPAKKASKQVIKPPTEDYLDIPPCPPAPNVHLGLRACLKSVWRLKPRLQIQSPPARTKEKSGI